MVWWKSPSLAQRKQGMRIPAWSCLIGVSPFAVHRGMCVRSTKTVPAFDLWEDWGYDASADV
eukprot:25187-Eustigmatos_ZCMA.PRE.1